MEKNIVTTAILMLIRGTIVMVVILAQRGEDLNIKFFTNILQKNLSKEFFSKNMS